MKLHRRTFLHLAAGAAASPALVRSAWAQAYPSRPVRLVVGFAAVKKRRTQPQRFSSGLPPKPDLSGLPRDVAEVPRRDVLLSAHVARCDTESTLAA